MCRIPIDGPLQNSSEYILVSSRPVTKLVHFNHLTQTYIVTDLGLKYAKKTGGGTLLVGPCMAYAGPT